MDAVMDVEFIMITLQEVGLISLAVHIVEEDVDQTRSEGGCLGQGTQRIGKA